MYYVCIYMQVYMYEYIIMYAEYARICIVYVCIFVSMRAYVSFAHVLFVCNFTT